MLRASASSLMAANTATNGTRTVQAGLPKPVPRCGAIYPPGYSGVDGDYRVSWHQKVANGQTIEPYATFRTTAIVIKALRARSLAVWGPLEYLDRRDALRRLAAQSSLGVEYQHTFKAINQRNGERTTRFSPLECTGKCVSSFSYSDTAFGQPFFLCDERYYLATQNRDSQVTDTQWQGLMSQLRCKASIPWFCNGPVTAMHSPTRTARVIV